MEYKILDKLMPNTPNPEFVQNRIDLFLANNNVDEDVFNGILADIELVGFAKGLKVGYALYTEISGSML